MIGALAETAMYPALERDELGIDRGQYPAGDQLVTTRDW
jgi:hypothetical protein